MKIIETLMATLHKEGTYNADAQVAPTCILWTDKVKQWEPIIPRLLAELPELLVYGTYTPTQRTGPAIWLKCAIDNKI